MKDCENHPPILITRAKGMKIYDVNGNFYYDTISSWWCNIHGHNHPKVNSAIERQLRALDHVLLAGFTHKSAISLAEKLISITPKSLKKVFFSDNGSTSVETALKMSFQYWQNKGNHRKKKFICLDNAYHGDTIGAMSVSGVDIFNKVFSPLMFPTLKIPSPYCYRCPVGKMKETCKTECIKFLEDTLRANAGDVAGIIIEPLLLAAGGMIIYPAEYLKKVSTLAKTYSVHLILDEVATGFGRTGKMFACEHANVTPDFICLSKGITSGYLPLGATLTTDEIYDAFYGEDSEKRAFYHGHTYTGNPISCAAALASIQLFEEEGTLDKIGKIIPFFHKGLDRLRTLNIVGDVRYLGMIGAVELVKNKETKEPFSFEERIGLKIYKEGLKRHLLLRPLGNVIYLYLPLCVKKIELEYILDTELEILRGLPPSTT